jgi:heme/copper-type cytochrome/quinol oxidase subunit 2
MNFFRRLFSAIAAPVGALFMMFAFNASAFAQCAMCKTSVEGSTDAAKLSSKIDLGVLVLFIPVILILSVTAWTVYRYRNYFGAEESESHEIETFVSEADSRAL